MKERMKKHGKELERPNQIQQQKGRRKSTANENNDTAVRDWDEEREKIVKSSFFSPSIRVPSTTYVPLDCLWINLRILGSRAEVKPVPWSTTESNNPASKHNSRFGARSVETVQVAMIVPDGSISTGVSKLLKLFVRTNQ